jgi:N-acetylmuramoyl-L-alanine amidase
MTAGRLTVQPNGRVTGPASITYNDPWPVVNGGWGSGAMMGAVMHTMVGNLPSCIAWFNNPAAKASAHFGIDQAGGIHQFGPIGKGWCAWAEAEGNATWYSIEHADNGNPDIPLTSAQMTASAQLAECLSAFAGFPLQVSDSVDVKGYGVHFMGGEAWGGHTCPDEPPAHVRSSQRAEIIARAKAIRDPAPAPKPVPRLTVVSTRADGSQTMAGFCAANPHNTPAIVIELTLSHYPGGVFEDGLGEYVDAGEWGKPLPKDAVIWFNKEEELPAA